MNVLFILFTVTCLTFTCPSGKITYQVSRTGYNLSAPDKYLLLPDNLREISGLTIIDSTSFACIQDEDGIMFFYDIKENQIKRQVQFGERGDYEDIARVNKTIFILRSDGTLFEIADFTQKTFTVNKYKPGVPSDDSEGLCYDKNNYRLLIGCKGEIKMDNYKNERAVFSFDLYSKRLQTDPVLVLDPKVLKKLIEGNRTMFPLKKEEYEKAEIKISALAIHPITGDIFVLSADDNLLYVINKNGSFRYIEPLNKELFRQAEGIAFFPNGDMLISNEARGKKPILLRFNYESVR